MWIPWGDGAAFDAMEARTRKGFRQLQKAPIPRTALVGDLYRLLQSFSLIVSDTYHVCVNAWRMGVPAVCIADIHPETAESVSSGHAYAWRDKRQCFYAMYDAMPYFTYFSELTDRKWRPRRVYQLTQLFNRPQV